VEARSADVETASNVTVPKPEKTAQSKLIYRVKRGDTLFSIAKLYRTTVTSLKQWNRIRGNAIQVGQRLTIFTHRATATN
jgi:membrane-bound lytic murein transglycosylase D